MGDSLLLVMSALLVNNLVLVQCLGLNSVMDASKKSESAVSMAAATSLVLVLSSVATYLLQQYLLLPWGLEYLRTLAFMLVIAIVVLLTGVGIRKISPALHRRLAGFLACITTNCAVLGVALLNLNQQRGFTQSLMYSLGAAGGFSLMLILFAALRERIAAADVPKAFQGTPIALITAGLMSLAFMGFRGLGH